VRLGIYVDARNPPAWRRPWRAHYAETLEDVEHAEDLGVQAVWLSEHHGFEDGYLSQPLTLAAAIAARTRTMRIGTAILLMPLRAARHVAEQVALIDQISGGRVELGLGSGYSR
jgi:alkanesulfonate monooxygenase SsuD/methylene tetrahydromethanopterin reductase-like flavin-dependent oxidoreductase (luciferase family)